MKNALKIFTILSLSVGLVPVLVYAQNDMKQAEMKQHDMMDTLTFKSLHAPTQGRVSFQKNPDGTYTLMIKGLKTEAAPDLKVWLYKKAVQDAADIKKTSGQYVVVGGLKTFSGNFSFKLPKSVKPDDFQSVVLWCDLVSTAFAAVNLQDHNMSNMMDMKSGEKMADGMLHSPTGSFVSLEAPTMGKVSFEGNKLVITGLKTEAAPDLKVWLYKKAVKNKTDIQKKEGSYVVLGGLKTFSGKFEFDLPAGVKANDHQSVVLWCDLVSAAFGVANLH